MSCPHSCSTLQTAGASSLEVMDIQSAGALGSGVKKVLCIPLEVPWKKDIPAVVAVSVGTSSSVRMSLRHWEGMRTRLADKK